MYYIGARDTFSLINGFGDSGHSWREDCAMTEDNVPAGTRGVKEFPEEGKQRAVGSSHARLGEQDPGEELAQHGQDFFKRDRNKTFSNLIEDTKASGNTTEAAKCDRGRKF